MTGLLRTQLAKLGMVRQLSVPFPFPQSLSSEAAVWTG